MIAADIAPGMNRSFLAEEWKHLVPRRYWYDALEEARERVDLSVDTDIQGYDIDAEALKAARANAKWPVWISSFIFSSVRSRAASSKALWLYYHESALWGNV